MKKIVMVMMVVLGISICQGYVLTFDDISTSDSGLILDSYNYGGFDWLPPSTGWGFYYLDASTANPNSGAVNGIVSGNYVAFPSTYLHAGIGGLISPEPFTFNGAYFTAMYLDELHIQIDGYQDNQLIYSTTVVADTTGPTWFNFNYINIDTLNFSASGGTHHQGYEYDYTLFVIDNFTYVPEPTTLLLFTLGILGIQRLNVKERRRFMNKIVMVMVLLSVCWCGKLEATIFYDDGVIHKIDSYIDDDVKVRNSTTGNVTTLNLFSGGHINGHLAGEDDSQINVFDGYIENNLAGLGNSTIEIYGGHVDATIWGYDNSEIYLSGGSVKNGLALRNNSSVIWSGGSLGTGVTLENDSQLTIQGSDFKIDGVGVGFDLITNTGEYIDGYGRTYSYGTLTATLYSGETINNSFYLYNNTTIKLVPEPATLILFTLGIFGIQRLNV